MSVQIPQFGTLPNSATMTESQFNVAWNNYFSNVDAYGAALTALGVEAEANAARAEAAAGEVANTVWVSGTNYAAGDVRYSPVDFLSYRRKTNGAGTTDPSQDAINWELLTNTSVGGAETTNSATDIALTFTSARLQVIGMTASGKKVTLPAATTIKKGTPLFVVKNTGAYRFSVHKNGGGFLCYVNPGQTIAAHCSDNGSSAGVWHVSGKNIDQVYSSNNAEVLNAVDSRYIAVAMLSATQAVCAFRNNSTGYLDAVVLNYGSASGSPAQVAAQTAKDISIAAQTNNQATIVYKTSTGTTRAVVLDITGSTFTPGTDKQIDPGTGGGGTAVEAMSSTQLVAVYQGAASTSAKMRVLDIVSSAINESSQVEVDPAAAMDLYFSVKKISSNKFMVFSRSSVLASANPRIKLCSLSGSTPAPTGTLLEISNVGSIITAYQFCAVVLRPERAAIIFKPFTSGRYDAVISLLDISGTTPLLIKNRFFNIGASLADVNHFRGGLLDSTNVLIMTGGAAAQAIFAKIINISPNDRITIANVDSEIDSGVADYQNQYFDCVALDSAHVMQVMRNASTYLSAKTLEIGT